MAHEDQIRNINLSDNRVDIRGEGLDGVIAVSRRLGTAVTPEIECDRPPAGSQVLELRRPLRGIAGQGMYEDHRQTATPAIIDAQGADARQRHLPGSLPRFLFISLRDTSRIDGHVTPPEARRPNDLLFRSKPNLNLFARDAPDEASLTSWRIST
jgi:hypothetical protein